MTFKIRASMCFLLAALTVSVGWGDDEEALSFVARAIDWPREVLPTPGGPTRHRIGPLSLRTRCCTATICSHGSVVMSLRFS